jgi:hypothetical protein
MHLYCAAQYRCKMTTNITIRVSSSLAREARVLAARRGTSLSRLVADQLAAIVRQDSSYEAAKSRALNRIDYDPTSEKGKASYED